MYLIKTHNPDNIEFCSPCYLCKHPEERPIRNKQKCSMAECDYLKCYEALAMLEEKIDKALSVKIHYKPPYEYKYAVVQYTCRAGKPLKVASYYTYGEELKTGEPLICWSWLPSTNFAVLEKDFNTEEEAIARMKELRKLKDESK